MANLFCSYFFLNQFPRVLGVRKPAKTNTEFVTRQCYTQVEFLSPTYPVVPAAKPQLTLLSFVHQILF